MAWVEKGEITVYHGSVEMNNAGVVQWVHVTLHQLGKNGNCAKYLAVSTSVSSPYHHVTSAKDPHHVINVFFNRFETLFMQGPYRVLVSMLICLTEASWNMLKLVSCCKISCRKENG